MGWLFWGLGALGFRLVRLRQSSALLSCLISEGKERGAESAREETDSERERETEAETETEGGRAGRLKRCDRVAQ